MTGRQVPPTLAAYAAPDEILAEGFAQHAPRPAVDWEMHARDDAVRGDARCQAVKLVDGIEIVANTFHPGRFAKMPPFGSVLKLVSPPAGGSSVENWAPRFEPLIGVPL